MARNLVVVGASAGGVEALRALVQALPADLDAAVLVVLHMPPGAPSALANILGRSGPLPAETARDGQWIQHGQIYVAPADRHMLVSDDRIVLSSDPGEKGHRPAVDPLFRSAAQHHGPRVIGVILSGSRDDGSAGLAAVVERGGIPVVQDPATALHRSMPCTALENLAVDHILHPAKIGTLLGELTGPERVGPEEPACARLTAESVIAELRPVTDERSEG